MFGTFYIAIDTVVFINLLALDIIGQTALWIASIIAFIIIIIIGLILLTLLSKKPENWEHKPVINNYYSSGQVKSLTDSLKMMNPNYNNRSLKDFINSIFYEKVRSTYGLTFEQLEDYKIKNRKKLEQMIQNKKISEWIFNDEKQSSLKRGIGRKEQFLLEIESIIDKMEMWGK